MPLQQAHNSYKRFTNNNTESNEDLQQNMQSMSDQEIQNMQMII